MDQLDKLIEGGHITAVKSAGRVTEYNIHPNTSHPSTPLTDPVKEVDQPKASQPVKEIDQSKKLTRKRCLPPPVKEVYPHPSTPLAGLVNAIDSNHKEPSVEPSIEPSVEKKLKKEVPENQKANSSKEKKTRSVASREWMEKNVPTGYECLLRWFDYKLERREALLEMSWLSLFRVQTRFQPHVVAASVDISMAAQWRGLFTHNITDQDAAAYLPKTSIPVFDDNDLNDPYHPDNMLARMKANHARLRAEEAAECGEAPEEIEIHGDNSQNTF